LTNQPLARAPRRTVDVMPSALTALGLDVPTGLDGTSFIDPAPRANGIGPRAAHLAHRRPENERDAESAVA
jgi:hypothetical protein